MPLSEVVVGEAAVTAARESGMFGSVQVRLAEMLKRSVPFGDDVWSRRFESFLLRIESGVLIDVCKMREDGMVPPEEVEERPPENDSAISCTEDDGEIAMLGVVCPDCDDDGNYCATCNSTGRVHESLARSF